MSWHIKTVTQLQRVTTPCVDDHQYAQGAFETVGELAEVCGADCVQLFVSCSNSATRFIVDSSCIGKSM